MECGFCLVLSPDLIEEAWDRAWEGSLEYEGADEGALEEGSNGASNSESESDPEGGLISAPHSELDPHPKSSESEEYSIIWSLVNIKSEA